MGRYKKNLQNNGKTSIQVWDIYTKSQEKRLDVNEMSVQRWLCGVIQKDNIRNEHERISKVSPVTKNIT